MFGSAHGAAGNCRGLSGQIAEVEKRRKGVVLDTFSSLQPYRTLSRSGDQCSKRIGVMSGGQRDRATHTNPTTEAFGKCPDMLSVRCDSEPGCAKEG